MEEKERQLEWVAAKAEEFEVPQELPVFELYVAFTSMALAIMLYIIPEYIMTNYALNHLLIFLMPQVYWATFFLTAGIVSALGMLARSKITRKIGLALISFNFSLVAYCYIVEFPEGAFGAVTFCMTVVFSVISVPMVKNTGLGDKPYPGKERFKQLIRGKK